MTRLVVLAALVLSAVLISRPADACTCGGGGQACQAFFDVSAVFAGTVVSISNRDDSTVFSRRRVHLLVTEAFRGVTSQEIDVDTGNGGGDCGYDFKIGESYVVYGHRQSDAQPLTTSICTRTRPLRDAEDDLKFARAAAGASAAGGVINGWVWQRDRRRPDPPPEEPPFAVVPGVAISVECGGLVHRAESDCQRAFRDCRPARR